MKKDNRWIHGKRKFVGPALPKNLKGVTCCLFQEAVFDIKVGKEIYLAILEKSDYSETYGSLKDIKLFCNTGVGRTTHGIIIFIIFSVYNESNHISDYELFLNPHNMKTINMISSLGQQLYLKVVVYNSEQDHLCNLFILENVFGFDELPGNLAQVIDKEDQGNFAKAKEEFINRYTLQDLLKM